MKTCVGRLPLPEFGKDQALRPRLHAGFSAGKTTRAGITTIGLRNMAKGRHATTVTVGHSLTRDDTGCQHSQSRIIRETKTFSGSGTLILIAAQRHVQ